jgi:mono/diheme cytochrome c family protein|tara:strand:+ start:73 stop:393 length:321 start_codon:yes stop_codon:yes gene_type:complete
MIKNNFYFLVIIVSINFFFLSAKSDDMFDLGKDVFLNKAVCSACHTLADAGSSGDIGPNLNEIRPDKMRVINTVTNGIGVMPPYEDQLTLEEIEAVAHYVSISATN